jgi:hypothetical protein
MTGQYSQVKMAIRLLIITRIHLLLYAGMNVTCIPIECINVYLLASDYCSVWEPSCNMTCLPLWAYQDSGCKHTSLAQPLAGLVLALVVVPQVIKFCEHPGLDLDLAQQRIGATPSSAHQ